MRRDKMLISEYTMPLRGIPCFRSVGIIKAVDKMENCYNIGEVTFERYDDQNYQYIFSPYWNLIEYLPEDLFDGIPGIDMSIKKQHYYRVNMTPSFISKRTPSASREDLWKLLEEVGLDYYDRFEWLLRTDKYCGDDNFIVERKRSKSVIFEDVDVKTLNEVQPGDKIILDRMCDIAPNRSRLSESIFRLLQSGAMIHIKEDDFTFSVETFKSPLYILERMMAYESSYSRVRQEEGIRRAREEGRYKGRSPIKVDSLLFANVVMEFEKGILSEKQALERVGVSRSTFYRRLKEWKEKQSK